MGNNEYFSKKNSYTSKKYWFDSQYYFVLLAIMFKDLWFYCYSEVTKDLFVFKYDKGQRKAIVKNTRIYHLVHYNHCVCILHCDNIHYKALIRKEKKMLSSNILNDVNYSTLITPPSHFSPELKQIIHLSQSPSIYDSARIKTIASSQEKRTFQLDYRDTLSSPKIRKMNEKFNSCYCWTLFDYCHICVSGLCSTHQTIKCSGECERIFHVSCTDINKIDFLKNCKTN